MPRRTLDTSAVGHCPNEAKFFRAGTFYRLILAGCRQATYTGFGCTMMAPGAVWVGEMQNIEKDD
jgi:hypothetical protein